MSTRASLFYDSETRIHMFQDLWDGDGNNFVYIEDAEGWVVAIRCDVWEKLRETPIGRGMNPNPPKDSKPESQYYPPD